MSAALIDTNVLLRLLQPLHPQYPVAARALSELYKQKVDFCIAPQNLVEFWVVATRPIALNGLGMSPLTVAGQVQTLRALFRILEGTPGVAVLGRRLLPGSWFPVNLRMTPTSLR